jgi:hypothetical protein
MPISSKLRCVRPLLPFHVLMCRSCIQCLLAPFVHLPRRPPSLILSRYPALLSVWSFFGNPRFHHNWCPSQIPTCLLWPLSTHVDSSAAYSFSVLPVAPRRYPSHTVTQRRGSGKAAARESRRRGHRARRVRGHWYRGLKPKSGLVGLRAYSCQTYFIWHIRSKQKKNDCPQSLYAWKAKKGLHVSGKEAVSTTVVQQNQIKNTCVGYETESGRSDMWAAW